MAPKRIVTVEQLQEALKNKDWLVRYNAIFDFSQSRISIDAIPILLAALKDNHPGVVRYAAKSLGKIGPEALSYGERATSAEVIRELRYAAAKTDEFAGLPQAYDFCLEAMVNLDPRDYFLVGFIHDHIGITNWDYIKASLQALKTIGTAEALDLLNRSVAFWMPELNKKQKKFVEEIVAGKR